MNKSYIVVYQGNEKDLETAFKENSIQEYIILNSQLSVIYVPMNFDEKKLNNIKQVSYWQLSNPMSSLIEITNNLKEGESVTTAAGTDYIYKNPYITSAGKDVVIAIIDSGIDYLHPDFIKEDNTTKIISIWDQECSDKDKQQSCVFGRKISKDEINEAIKNNDNTLTQDEIGTGTIAAGICCGRGVLNPLYKGVAVDSELIVVKLRQYKGEYMDGKVNYQSSDFLAAIKYVIDIAKQEDKFLIINLTVGDRSTATTETIFLDSFTDLNNLGIILVSGAGNEGNTDIHYEGTMKSVGEIQDIIFQVGKQKDLDIIICTNGPDKISASLISPSGELSFNVEYSPEYYIYKGRFNIENTFYEMKYVYPWIESGNEQLYIYLKDVKPGIWTIRLKAEFIVDGEFDIYLPNKNLISPNTRFIDPNSSSTITLYATVQNMITVGTYNDKTDSMWIGSSKGPIKKKNVKPDIVAPGVDIVGTFKNKSYNTGTGTGVSSSLVCGVLAIIMNYLKEQDDYERSSLFTQVLKTYLMLGATKQEIYKYPNIAQGYGILNLKETIIQIANNLE